LQFWVSVRHLLRARCGVLDLQMTRYFLQMEEEHPLYNPIAFVGYIKFGPQTFDCYIFYFESFFFSIWSLRIWFFFINFGPRFFNCYLLFSYPFFNQNFLSIIFGSYSFDCYLFYLK
jgi:hypothetical protein